MPEALAHITDFATTVPGWQVTLVRQVAGIAALNAAVAQQIQDAENALWDVYVNGRLENATGAALDRYGALIGETRGGLGDDEFRAVVRAFLVARSSQGHPDTILRVAIALAGIATDGTWRYWPIYPAGFEVQFGTDGILDSATRSRVRRAVETATPAGVAVVGIAIWELSFVFGFAEDASAGLTTPAWVAGFDDGPLAEGI